MLKKTLVRGLILVAIICVGLLEGSFSSAVFLPNRSVTVSTALPSAASSQLFKFDIPTTAVIGSVVFEYCSNSPLFADVCNPPVGLDLSGVSLTSQSGNVGFSLDATDSTANKIIINRVAGPGIVTASSYDFSNVINSSVTGTTYVRISTHAATDGSGPDEDDGAVAYAVLNAFNVGAYVPPFLQLCVGITVAPDCSSTSGDSIDLGNLSASRANYATSQYAVATNDETGYTIYSLGTTMTSGNNVISNLTNPTPSFPGTPQFGINERANLIPPVGQDPVGLGTGIPTANYNQPNRFIFVPGDAIASSDLTTNYNRMTVSYLVNVASNQPVGVYATTITYMATVSF